VIFNQATIELVPSMLGHRASDEETEKFRNYITSFGYCVTPPDKYIAKIHELDIAIERVYMDVETNRIGRQRGLVGLGLLQ